MTNLRRIQWYNFQTDLIWPDRPFTSPELEKLARLETLCLELTAPPATGKEDGGYCCAYAENAAGLYSSSSLGGGAA